MFWTAERVAELKIRWDKNGESAMQICLAMNAVSRGAIIGKARRLGLAVRATKHANGARRANGSPPRKTGHKARGVTQVTRARRPVAANGNEIKATLVDFKNPKRLWELRDCDCRWPGAGHGVEILFCGEPAVEGKSYCFLHCRIAYLAPGSRAGRVHVVDRNNIVLRATGGTNDV
jgi:GcrA cell cycle regulator